MTATERPSEVFSVRVHISPSEAILILWASILGRMVSFNVPNPRFETTATESGEKTTVTSND
jgi:hypothetical protein